jgi:hypothetical protein
MGIRPSSSEDEEVDMSLPMFSDDILRVEIAGPDVREDGRLVVSGC